MDKNVIVAICTPYYKKSEFLVRLIESIKMQTFQDYIVVVTDDGSDDRAKEYIASLGERYIYPKIPNNYIHW